MLSSQTATMDRYGMFTPTVANALITCTGLDPSVKKFPSVMVGGCSMLGLDVCVQVVSFGMDRDVPTQPVLEVRFGMVPNASVLLVRISMELSVFSASTGRNGMKAPRHASAPQGTNGPE